MYCRTNCCSMPHQLWQPAVLIYSRDVGSILYLKQIGLQGILSSLSNSCLSLFRMTLFDGVWSYPRLLQMCQAKYNRLKILPEKKINNFKCAWENLVSSYPRLLKMCQAQFNKFKVLPQKKIQYFEMFL